MWRFLVSYEWFITIKYCFADDSYFFGALFDDADLTVAKMGVSYPVKSAKRKVSIIKEDNAECVPSFYIMCDQSAFTNVFGRWWNGILDGADDQVAWFDAF